MDKITLKLFYSREQESLYARMNQSISNSHKSYVCSYRTSDGRIVEVTEAKSSDNPSSFSDAVFLGETVSPGISW